MENPIALAVVIFFVLFSFIGILRKPLTCLAFLFVIYQILFSFLPDLESEIILISVSGVITLIATLGCFKSRIFSCFLYGFVLMNLTMYQLLTCIDAFSPENATFIAKLLTNQLAIKTNILNLCGSIALGTLFVVFNKRFVELITSLFGTFMIVIYLIDISRGGVSSPIPFDSTLFTGLLDLINDVVIKNTFILIECVEKATYLNIYIACGISVVVCVLTTFIKRNKYEFL